MILWKYSFKELRRHPGRAVLTLLSVVIGVATVVAVFSATRTTRAAYRQMFQTVNGNAELEIVGNGGVRFDEEVLKLAVETPGVKAAVPMVRRNTILYAEQNRAKVTALGIDLKRNAAVHDYELVAGTALDNGTGVWLDAHFARRMGIELNDEIKLLTRIGLKRSEVIGMIEPKGGSAVAHGGLVYMSIRRAQHRFRIGLKVDAISIVLDQDADENAIREIVSAKLPEGLVIQRPATRTDVTDEAMLANDQGLRLATAFMLLLAVFVITNTFAMNVGQRRRQFAVMRAIGATKRQVATVLYREALLMGLTGTILGILVGWLGARLLTASISSVMLVDLPPVQITRSSLFIASFFGLGIAILGAFLPARQAASLTPVEAMVVVPPRGSQEISSWIPLIGVGIIFGSTAMLLMCIQGHLPIELAVAGSVAGLVGLVMLIPMVLKPASSVIQRVLLPWMKVESRLAQRQLLRHRGRTTLTVGVLFIAVSTGIALASTISNNLADVQKWYERAIVGDFFVRAMMPDMSTGEAADLPEGLRSQIAEFPGITNVDRLKFVSARTADESSVLVIVREFRERGQEYFDMVQGDADEVVQQVNAGQVVIGTVLSQRRNLGVGDSITLETSEGQTELKIAAVANDYLGGGLTVYMDRPVGERLLNVTGEDLLVVKCEPQFLREVEERLNEICGGQGLLLQSYAQLVSTVHAMMAGIVGSLRALLVLGFVVAAFGVVNTLSMNVLEQTRELGMLRIVAMTRAQVRRVIFAQATMMGLIGLIPGVVTGVFVAYVINLSSLPVLGHPVVFHLYPLGLMACLLAAGAMILFAAWIPAERAARVSPLDAMRYE